MREIKLEELKKIQIEILDEVHHFCEENRITYFLSSGTLLGAVRHKGYIPWDDDIDIYMPRDSYEHFLRSFPKSDDTYGIISLTSDSRCILPYAKVENRKTRLIETVDNPMEVGVNIDVFPVDGVPDNMRNRRKYFAAIQRLRNKMVIKSVSVNFRRRGIIKNGILILGKILLLNTTSRSLAERLDNFIDKNNINSDYVCNLVLGNGIKSCFSRTCIEQTVDIMFEGKLYKTMKGFDEYLRCTYGDYMVLPPEDRRVSHHQFEAYWID